MEIPDDDPKLKEEEGEENVIADKDAEPTEGDEIVFTDKVALIDIVDLSHTYGEHHRGATAKKDFNMSDSIQSEAAAMWVTFPVVDPDDNGVPVPVTFFMGTSAHPYHVVPPELDSDKVRGGILIALTALMIKYREDKCNLMVSQTEWALFGRCDNTKYETAEKAYELVKSIYFSKKNGNAERRQFLKNWNLERFGRMYAVVQVNAILAYSPISVNVYGAGMFPGSVFFNHSCKPNAIATVYPGKLTIQAISPIKKGEEITIAYKELPIDLLSVSLTRFRHVEMGFSDRGCRCEFCMEVDAMEAAEIAAAA